MRYKVKEGKNNTFTNGLKLGECTDIDLKRLYESGDIRFIDKLEEAPEIEEKKPKSSKKEKDKEEKENES